MLAAGRLLFLSLLSVSLMVCFNGPFNPPEMVVSLLQRRIASSQVEWQLTVLIISRLFFVVCCWLLCVSLPGMPL